MPSCLGMCIEQNLIKYAKVSKNNELVKVESFGVKFYDNITLAIKQVIEETYSFKLPISINASDEILNEIEVFSLLSRKDMDSTIKTEFENICAEKDVSKNLYEQKYLLTDSSNISERIKAIHFAIPKTFIEQRKNQFSEYKISNIIPTSIAIEKLIKKEKKGTSLIVNIEKDTTITKIKNGKIIKIKLINDGADEILQNINKKENSYSKAYEICKNSTIYTDSDKDLQYEENEYLEDIMPTLYKIVSEVRKFIDEGVETVEKVYITGTGTIINNVDIYFQDYLKNTTCELLKPSFVSSNSKINIKDYMEVNSAISLAVYALEKDNNKVDFLSDSGFKKVWAILNSDVGSASAANPVDVLKKFNNFPIQFGKQYNIATITLLLATTTYLSGVCLINNQLNNKISEADESIKNTNKRIAQVQEYNKKFNSLATEYDKLITSIENENNANLEDKRYRNSIPNLLNNIMSIIPKNVQLISIDNTSGTHIVITAKSKNYEEIAYFKTKLKTEEILENVVSDTGSASGGYLSVTIEGELP